MRELLIVVILGLFLAMASLVFQSPWLWSLAERVMPF
jgi:hypothetical protein